ncbi:hypothetical protein AG1IA_02396 [Rhizoctonia solani AG-1 IA]|uniref:N-acetyltransferase domain-containing protein n=1 Tax=Thanatephorus cucumeris (strain AG1-IA) TaxID=983506 RepID=L8X4M4_THACA|nr:hypothetical protein AG1IA_02396 [Rhizoctonia solani AG-1 IA]
MTRLAARKLSPQCIHNFDNDGMVEVINNYTPPPPKGPVTLPDPDPSIHGQALVEGMKPHPELLQYLPWNPFDTLHEFELHFEQRIRSDPTWMVYALLDKSKIIPGQVHGQLAGTIGYLRASPETASVEIGYVIVLPSYQRTFVSTHAIGLLLDYALQKPGDGGLGLLYERRSGWDSKWREFFGEFIRFGGWGLTGFLCDERSLGGLTSGMCTDVWTITVVFVII